jgi:hypothetical protein
MICWGMLLAGVSFALSAPRRPREQPQPVQQPPLAEERLRAAEQQFELIWQYYQQSRVESFDVYVWSRLVLDSRLVLCAKPTDRSTAYEDHLERMRKLETLVKKIRRLGFGRSSDVGAAAYYRIEAEAWLATSH